MPEGLWISHGAALGMLVSFLAVCAFCLTVTLLWAVYPVRWRGRRLFQALQTVLFIVLTLDLALLSEYNRSFYEAGAFALPDRFLRIPLAAHIMLFASSAVLSAVCLFVIRRRSRMAFSLSSVRQAIDNLPAGVCFASADGQPLLVNRSMDALVRELTGGALQDLNVFWTFLENKNQVTYRYAQVDLPYAGDVTATTADGSIVRFTRGTLHIRGQVFTEVIASELTQQYQLYNALAKDTRALAEQRQKLRALSESLEQMNHEEEVLRHKIRIHNEIGRTLLATRRFLSSDRFTPENINIYSVLWRELCEKNRFLHYAEAPDDAQALREIMNAAGQIGCRINIRGVPPEDGDRSRIFRQLLRECVVNAVRHAGADTMDVEVHAAAGQTQIRVRNNGRPPDGEVCEGGGLGALRRAVENAGGTMTVETRDAFVLTVTLPE